MNPLADPHIAFLLIVLMMVLTTVLYRLSHECRCKHCAYHVNERHEAEKHQAALSHEVTHKGFGYTRGAPDIKDCPDMQCRRNRHEQDSDTLDTS